MAATAGAAAGAEAAAKPKVASKAVKNPADRTPWWMWIAGAAIVIFCLFPFYWLINVSLRTGSGTTLIN